MMRTACPCHAFWTRGPGAVRMRDPRRALWTWEAWIGETPRPLLQYVALATWNCENRMPSPRFLHLGDFGR